MPNSIRKSKIFERTTSSDNYLRNQNSVSRRNISKTPDNKKKIFNLSTVPSKSKHRDMNNIEVEGSPEASSKVDFANLRSITPPALESSLDLNSNPSNYDLREKSTGRKEL
jgi:hypothetical protein